MRLTKGGKHTILEKSIIKCKEETSMLKMRV